MMRALLVVPAGLLAAMFVLAACGEKEELDSSGVPTAVSVDADTVPDGAPAIDQEDLTFIPASLTVESGEIVYLRNSETAIHTVNFNGLNVSGDMRKGDVLAWTAPAPGVYKVTCDYHPQMKATVTVEEPAD